MINKRCAALVMAAILAASSAMPAMASVTIDGKEVASESTVGAVSTKNEDDLPGVEVTDGSSVKVNGNVEAKEWAGDGVSVSGKDSSASVEGNVSAVDGNGVSVSGDGAYAIVRGDVSSDYLNGVSTNDKGKAVVTGSVSSESGTGVYAIGDSSVNVRGDVNVHDEISTGIEAEDSSVTVKGDVISKGDGIYADHEFENSELKTSVDVKGNVNSEGNAIVANGNTTTVKVGGNVTSDDGAYAVQGNAGANIIVGGDVIANGEGSVGVDLDDSSASVDGNVKGDDGVWVVNSELHVKGDVTSKSGFTVTVYGTDKSVCIIEGNVNSETDSICLDVSLGDADGENNKDNELAIAGTVKNGGNGATIYVDVDSDNKDKVNNSAEIVVGEIEDINKITVRDYSSGEEVSDAAKKEVIDNIKYIVSTKTDGLNGNGTITVTKLGGGALDKDKSGTYTVGKATETITIQVDTKEGYEVSEVKAGKATASLVKNADGTYSVTIPAGGGVNIEALLKAIENKADTSDSNGNVIYTYSDSRDDDRSSSSNGTTSAWTPSGDTWTYTKSNGQNAKDEWQQISYNGQQYWYYFGSDAKMSTGLITDAKAHQYYLTPAEGSLKGTMVTGWVEVNGKWMFFNDGSVADLPLGCYVEGMTR